MYRILSNVTIISLKWVDGVSNLKLWKKNSSTSHLNNDNNDGDDDDDDDDNAYIFE